MTSPLTNHYITAVVTDTLQKDLNLQPLNAINIPLCGISYSSKRLSPQDLSAIPEAHILLDRIRNRPGGQMHWWGISCAFILCVALSPHFHAGSPGLGRMLSDGRCVSWSPIIWLLQLQFARASLGRVGLLEFPSSLPSDALRQPRHTHTHISNPTHTLHSLLFLGGREWDSSLVLSLPNYSFFKPLLAWKAFFGGRDRVCEVWRQIFEKAWIYTLGFHEEYSISPKSLHACRRSQRYMLPWRSESIFFGLLGTGLSWWTCTQDNVPASNLRLWPQASPSRTYPVPGHMRSSCNWIIDSRSLAFSGWIKGESCPRQADLNRSQCCLEAASERERETQLRSS